MLKFSNIIPWSSCKSYFFFFPFHLDGMIDGWKGNCRLSLHHLLSLWLLGKTLSLLEMSGFERLVECFKLVLQNICVTRDWSSALTYITEYMRYNLDIIGSGSQHDHVTFRRHKLIFKTHEVFSDVGGVRQIWLAQSQDVARLPEVGFTLDWDMHWTLWGSYIRDLTSKKFLTRSHDKISDANENSRNFFHHHFRFRGSTFITGRSMVGGW